MHLPDIATTTPILNSDDTVEAPYAQLIGSGAIFFLLCELALVVFADVPSYKRESRRLKYNLCGIGSLPK